MKTINFICLLILLHFSLYLGSQGLKIGEVVPDIEVKNISNYSSDKLRLSNFNKKLIILDFWSTNCSGCIKAFPKIESLQKTFKEDVQILLINRSSKDSTERFFSMRKKIFKPTLPFITGDTKFQKMFPHSGEPFYVVIDSLKRVQFFPEAITFASIKSYLGKGQIKSQQRKKQVYLQSPIDERITSSVKYSSVLINTPSGFQLTKLKNDAFEGLTFNFLSILDLYLIAYNDKTNYFHDGFIIPGRSILAVKDSFNYITPKNSELYDDWKENNSYSYQLTLPKKLKLNKYEIMRQDLKRCFGLEVKIEKRKVKCLTLVRTSTKDKIKSSGGIEKDTYMPAFVMAAQIDSVRSYLNKDYGSFSKRLRYIVEYYFKQPFMDGTGYNKSSKVNMEMNGEVMDFFDLTAYKKELRKYDLDLQEKSWLIDVLVIKEAQ
jgi:thiol-disulfide isomerase/thioredoxin